MFLKISRDYQLSLEEADDFRRFHISVEAPINADWTDMSDFAAISEDARDGHYWLDADAVKELSPRKGDKDWLEAYWQMLSKAESYGYYDSATRKIKAHLA